MKEPLSKATLLHIDESQPFVVECDASDISLSATLIQGGRPVAFMSRTFTGSEKYYAPVENEATAIIEPVRKWAHLISSRHFKIATDQCSVAFMFDSRKRTKVKNSEIIMSWRLELSSFSYSIRYHPGKENVAPDALTRTHCASFSSNDAKLKELHEGLCYPGISRMLHFVHTKNLPFSTKDVKHVNSSCRTCAQQHR